MNAKSKRLFLFAVAIFAVVTSISGWAAIKVVAWARDLPNRVVIDEDALAAAIGPAITESYHSALRQGDSALQTQILTEQFAPAITDHPDTAEWIRDEFYDDIVSLANADDADVASAASDVLAAFPPESDPANPSSGG